MADLNIVSNRIVFVFECAIKSDPKEFQKWIKNRASKYVYNLKEKKSISYEWHLSGDNKEATLIETFVDSRWCTATTSKPWRKPHRFRGFRIC